MAVFPYGNDPQGDRFRLLENNLTGFDFQPRELSWLVDPVYLPGRYDTIAMPAFLLLYAIGLERLSRVRIGQAVVLDPSRPGWRSTVSRTSCR